MVKPAPTKTQHHHARSSSTDSAGSGGSSKSRSVPPTNKHHKQSSGGGGGATNAKASGSKSATQPSANGGGPLATTPTKPPQNNNSAPTATRAGKSNPIPNATAATTNLPTITISSRPSAAPTTAANDSKTNKGGRVPAIKITTDLLLRDASHHSEAYLHDDEIKRLGQRFKKLDVDSSGSISLVEFISLPTLRDNPLIGRIVSIFDLDKNGEVDFREFIHGMSQFIYSNNISSRQKFAFRMFDIDNDGYISTGELFQVLRLMCGSNLTDEQLQQQVDHTFIMCDTDGDGKISLEEFCAATASSDVYKKMMIDKVLFV